MLSLTLFALAAPQIRIVAEPPASVAAAEAGIDVFVMNEGDAPVQAVPPAELAVTSADGVALRIVPAEPMAVTVAAGGFRTIRYRTSVVPVVAAAPVPADVPARRGETRVATATGTTSGFLDRFEPHEPVYGAFGFGSDGAKLQYSLAFRPFDGAGALDGVRLAWTQTMFWAIDEPSGPFRSTNYSPEVYYQRSIGERVTAAVGYAHDSNGRGPIGSIDVNRVYLGGSYAVPVGGGWSVELSPRVWTYVGTGYRDLDRYWGNASLGAAIGQVDGLRVEASLRNPTGDRRAVELYASYPLVRLGGGTGIYLFGQGFAGYGEAIDDFRRRSSSARIGVAFTR